MTGKQKYKVLLSELRKEDKQVLFDWINNKELVEFNSFFKPVTWESHCKWFDNIKNKKQLKYLV